MLYHFSDRGDIRVFEPRAPLRHPESEPLVYAIDEWHSALYLFPRDCPRIGVWPVASTSSEERRAYEQSYGFGMRLLIDSSFEPNWRAGRLFRYAFSDLESFIDCHDHGVWASRNPVIWSEKLDIVDLPEALDVLGATVQVVDLADAARGLYDFDAEQPRTTLHVSMIRMSLLPGWTKRAGRPVLPNGGIASAYG